MTKINHYHGGILRVDGRPGDYLVEQAHWATKVYRLAADRKTRDELALPRRRYALSIAADRAAFDSNVLAAIVRAMGDDHEA